MTSRAKTKHPNTQTHIRTHASSVVGGIFHIYVRYVPIEGLCDFKIKCHWNAQVTSIFGPIFNTNKVPFRQRWFHLAKLCFFHLFFCVTLLYCLCLCFPNVFSVSFTTPLLLLLFGRLVAFAYQPFVSLFLQFVVVHLCYRFSSNAWLRARVCIFIASFDLLYISKVLIYSNCKLGPKNIRFSDVFSRTAKMSNTFRTVCCLPVCGKIPQTLWAKFIPHTQYQIITDGWKHLLSVLDLDFDFFDVGVFIVNRSNRSGVVVERNDGETRITVRNRMKFGFINAAVQFIDRSWASSVVIFRYLFCRHCHRNATIPPDNT